MKVLLNSFNAGEVNPVLAGRVDLENLRRACLQLRNFMPHVLGGAYRRPPMLHVGAAAVPDAAARLIPFVFSATTKFILELGPLTMRVWRGDGTGVLVESITTPWGAADLDGIQFSQVNDVMFLVHPLYPTQRLIRFGDTDWRLADLFDSLVTPTAPTIPGEAGKVVMEWWLDWAGPLPAHVAAMQAIRTDAALYAAPSGSADLTSLALGAQPASNRRVMRRVLGVLNVPTTGTWRFYFTGDDGCCAFLNETYIGGEVGSTAEHFYDVALTAGINYRLEAYSWNAAGALAATISVSGPGVTKTPVPASMLRKRDAVAPLDELAQVVKYPPMLDENIGATTLTLSHTSGTGRTLTASAALFKPGHVGGFWQVGHFRDTLTAELTFLVAGGDGQAGTSPEIRIKGRAEFLTVGSWAGNVFIEEKNAAGGWDIVRKWTGQKDRNITASLNYEGEAVLRIRGTDIDPAAADVVDNPRFILDATESLVFGLVKVTGVTSDTVATVDVLNPVYSTAATSNWAEGAWSNERGFPRAVAIHEGRLILAGTRTEPQKLWASVSGDFLNYQTSILADGAIALQIGAQEANPILWMASQSGLIIGTQGDEWLLEGGTEGLRPDNAVVKRQSRYGSEPVQAVMAGATVLFVQRGGHILSEYIYRFEEQSYIAPDLTKLMGHLLRAGIRSVTYAQNPDQVLYIITRDGKLLTCTYQRTEEVVAWAYHPTDGEVDSAAVIYGGNGIDEVWLAVRRAGTSRIERFDPDHWTRLHQATEPVFHADAAVVARGTGLTTLAGLDHLEGRIVSVMTDGGVHPERTVTGGQIEIEAPATFIAAGLPCPALLQVMPVELPLQDGSAQGRKFHVPHLTVRLYQTAGLLYSDAPDGRTFVAPFRVATHDQNDPPPPFTGMVRLPAAAKYQDEVTLTFRSNGPSALNLMSVIPNIQVYGS